MYPRIWGFFFASSTINISDTFSISDVNVTIDITQPWVGDLYICIRGPDGTLVELSTFNGGSGDNYTNTTFDDEASISIVDGSPPFTGSFRPEGSLSDFDGKTTNGTWTLYVDNWLHCEGTLNSWSLTITFPATAPYATTNAATNVTSTGATLNGMVNDNGAETTVTFEYGLTTSYGNTVTAGQSPVAAGSGDTAVSKAITGLSKSTTYHYRVVAQNIEGTINGSDMTFITSAEAVFYVVSSDDSGVERNTFDLNEPVYCYAGNLPADDLAVDIYVVPNRDDWAVGNVIGSDVSSDDFNTVSTDSSGNINVTEIWPSPLTVGHYDIMVDLDQDGELDAGEPIDGWTTTGFEAIPEFTTIATPVAAVLGLVFLMSRRGRHSRRKN